MAISLSQLCANSEEKYSMRLMAGSAGLENSVRWVHIVEDSEVPDFLHGNELIFTTGIGHSGNEWLIDFTSSLKERGAVGLIVNIGPYISAVPPQVIVFCEQNSFPLFTIPWTTRIIDMSYDFCRSIIANEKRENTIADSFRAIIRSPDSVKEYLPVFTKSGFGENSRYTIISIMVEKGGFPATQTVVRNTDMVLWKTLKHSKFHSTIFMNEGALTAVRQNCTDGDIYSFCELLKPIAENNDDVKIYIGVSETAEGLGKISYAYSQSRAALLTSRINGKEPIFYRDIGMMKLICAVGDRRILKEFADEYIGALEKYDAEKNSGYSETLKIYLQKNGSVNAVAEETGVHRNTVNGKIKNIRKMLGVELNAEDRSMLMLAYLIKDVLDIYNKDGGNLL